MTNPTTMQALAAFPQQLEAYYAAIPAEFRCWNPPSWEGIPSEHFNAIEQVCHIRDIEIDGYHTRLRQTLDKTHPNLRSIDSEALAIERSYTTLDADNVLSAFRNARMQTIALIESLTPNQLRRTAVFEGYGVVTLKGLVHFLCSHDQQHLAGLQWLMGQMDSSHMPQKS